MMAPCYPRTVVHTIRAVRAIMITLVETATAFSHFPFRSGPMSDGLLTRSSMKIRTKGISTPLATWESRIILSSGMPGSSTAPAPSTISPV